MFTGVPSMNTLLDLLVLSVWYSPVQKCKESFLVVWMSNFDPVHSFSDSSMESIDDPVMKCFVWGLQNSKPYKVPGDGE